MVLKLNMERTVGAGIALALVQQTVWNGEQLHSGLSIDTVELLCVLQDGFDMLVQQVQETKTL